MPADRLLATLLRSLQTDTAQQDTARVLGTGASLLTTLNNPLNVTLLTSQLLTAPAIWTRPDGLRTCLSFLGVFHSAAIRLCEHERRAHEKEPPIASANPRLESSIPIEEWVRAVARGADERSLRARHLLVLGGVLIGFQSQDEEWLSTSTRIALEGAFVKALNLALVEARDSDELQQAIIALALNHTFPYLADVERAQIDYDLLLPALMHSILYSAHGLRSGYFLGTADVDIRQVSDNKFDWSKTSASYYQVQTILSNPLISALGPLSRLVGHTVENLRDPWLVLSAVEDIAEFSHILITQWRQNKLSEIDASEDSLYLTDETRNITAATMWKLLRTTLFGLVIILRSAVGRLLGDGVLASDETAPHLAQDTLRSLRNLYFISSRLGSTSFSQYTFTYLTAIDVLSSYPQEVEAFLKSAAPGEIGHIPRHPLDRCLDLFFLNTAEHYTLVLPSQINQDLLMPAATPYLAAGGNANLLLIFEAAHSVALAVFSAPQNVDLTARQLPFYVEALFQVFPHNLSPRQFRLAFKNLLRITSPPSDIATVQPMLAATLLEILYERALRAPTTPLPNHAAGPPSALGEDTEPVVTAQSEQAVLVLTLLDTLPTLAFDLLEEWLPLSATLVNKIADPAMREHCKHHFWHILTGGEMDAERSQICVAWWTTGGGRETLMFGAEPSQAKGELSMSGALPHDAGAKL